MNSDGVGTEADANDFPEPEIDAKRADKDAELAKYVQVYVRLHLVGPVSLVSLYLQGCRAPRSSTKSNAGASATSWYIVG